MASSDGGRLAARELSFAYAGRIALRGVDLTVAPGEIVGLLGPNGSGKSTLIKVLTGVQRSYDGSATLDGREVREIPRRELAQRIAVVQQEPSFSFSFTAMEIVLMGRHPHLAGLALESSRDVDLARKALERCGASHLATRSIHELSSGERQRVVFARALTQQPRSLVLDEPASFLDIRHQVALYDIVREQVVDRGCGVLTALHDLNLAAEYCDRIYLLREGRVEASGSTESVLTYSNLRRVFDTDVYVDTNSVTGKMLVVPLPGRVQDGAHRE
jgi:iron complex transport system ATP-binding protein